MQGFAVPAPRFKPAQTHAQLRSKLPAKTREDFAVIRQSVSRLRHEQESKSNQDAMTRRRLEEAAQDVIQLKAIAAARQHQLTRLQATVEMKRAKLRSLEQGFRELNSKRTLLKEEVVSNSERLEKLSATCAVVRKAVAANQVDAEQVATKLSQRERERGEQAKCRLAQANTRISQLTKEIENDKTKVAELVASQNSLQSKYDGFGRALEKILRKRRETSDTLQGVIKQCEKLEANISRIQSATKEVTKNADRLTTQIQEIHTHMDNSEKLDAEAASLQSNITLSEQRLKDLDSSGRMLEAALTQLQKRIDELTPKKDNLKQQLNQKLERLSADQQAIAALEAECSEVLAKNNAMKGELAKLEAQAAILVKTTALEAAVEGLGSSMQTLDRDIEQLPVVKDFNKSKASWASGQKARQAKLKQRGEAAQAESNAIAQSCPWDEAAALRAAEARKQERDRLSAEKGELAGRRRNLEQALAQLEMTRRIQAQHIEEKEAILRAKAQEFSVLESQLTNAAKVAEAEFQQLQLAQENKIAGIRESVTSLEFTRRLDERKEKQAQDLAKLEAQCREADVTLVELKAEMDALKLAKEKAREEKARDHVQPRPATRTPNTSGTEMSSGDTQLPPPLLVSEPMQLESVHLAVDIEPEQAVVTPRRSARHRGEWPADMFVSTPSSPPRKLPRETMAESPVVPLESEVKTNKSKGRRKASARSPKPAKAKAPPLHPQQPQAMSIVTPKGGRGKGRKRAPPQPPAQADDTSSIPESLLPAAPTSSAAPRPSTPSSGATPTSPEPIARKKLPVERAPTPVSKPTARALESVLSQDEPLEEDDALMTSIEPARLSFRPASPEPNERKQSTPKSKRDKPIPSHQKAAQQQKKSGVHLHKALPQRKSFAPRNTSFVPGTSGRSAVKAFSDDENKSQDLNVFEFEFGAAAQEEGDEGHEMAMCEDQMTKMTLASPKQPKASKSAKRATGSSAGRSVPQSPQRIVSSVKHGQEAAFGVFGLPKSGGLDQAKKKQQPTEQSWFEDPEYGF